MILNNYATYIVTFKFYSQLVMTTPDFKARILRIALTYAF